MSFSGTKQRKCSCHSSDLYSTLIECPKCSHNSFDTIAGSCERRKCGLEFVNWPSYNERNWQGKAEAIYHGYSA